jgi:DNA-binding transcriptional ArsR family regulator
MNVSSSTTFAALAEPTRLSIIDMLASRGELAASDISKAFSCTPSAISQHLKVLREAGLARMQKRGQQRVYSLNPTPITEAGLWLQERTNQWNARLDAMETYMTEQTNKKENE